jgi:hypothetical protein
LGPPLSLWASVLVGEKSGAGNHAFQNLLEVPGVEHLIPMMGPVALTRILKAWSGGDQSALERLAPIIYAELRRLAARNMSREREGHFLQPSALVVEPVFAVMVRTTLVSENLTVELPVRGCDCVRSARRLIRRKAGLGRAGRIGKHRDRRWGVAEHAVGAGGRRGKLGAASNASTSVKYGSVAF